MRARLSIVAGLVVGIAVAALVLGGLVALTPDPDGAVDACPGEHADRRSVGRRVGRAQRLARAERVAAGRRRPARRRLAPPLPRRPARPGAATCPRVRVGQPAPCGGIGPEVVAAGSKTILPGVDVTP